MLLPHPRQVRLVVGPRAISVVTYASTEPWRADWVDDVDFDNELPSLTRPPAAVARQLNGLISDFEELLADATREEDVQVFIKDHPYLLDLRAISVDPKVPLGSEYVTDFVVKLAGGHYLLVELEQATHPLYTKTHNPAAPMTHAVRQVEDWLEWSYENLSYLRGRYPDIHEPRGLVIIGRRSSLDYKAAKALRRHNAVNKVRVATYDFLLLSAHLIPLRGACGQSTAPARALAKQGRETTRLPRQARAVSRLLLENPS
jgi:Shedu protein SduA, C-terminal